MATKKNKGGRPRKEIDFNLFESLCSIFCTQEEIASVFKIDVDTLSKRLKENYGEGFSECFKRFSATGKVSLRRSQFKYAVAGNATLLIWLGKQYLGQSDKQETENIQQKPIEIQIIETNS